MNADSNLSPKTRKLIDEASQHHAIYISAISVWEVAMLERKGKILLESSAHTWIKHALSLSGISLTPLSPEFR